MKTGLMALLLVGLGFATLAAESENLLKNGDFEDGLRHWQVPAWFKNGLTPEADPGVNQGPGNGSLKLAGRDASQGYVIQQIVIPADAKRLRISGWMKTQGFQNAWAARIQVEIFNAKSEKVGPGFPMITPVRNSDTDWTEYGRDIELPEGARYFRVILLTQYPTKPTPNAGIVWFDNIMVTRIAEPEKQE